ncbi:TetR family transcriptional regulator [Facklamia lactis]|uniref:TetR family transcriptional regulator n=1 Tax=Facklamia lactis TaxID=2749967 RepID=UPI0018CD9672|nr:TetR family transcriptional regulator [Facklamia lactis]MBG9979421.1 TetR family transcriptional regulator [Facklamia lactis]
MWDKSSSYESKKLEIVKGARKVFVRQGFVNTSMQDILEAASVSRRTLYKYFRNRSDVFIEVLKFDDGFNDNFESAVSFKEKSLTLWLENLEQTLINIEHTLIKAKTEFFISSDYLKNKTYKGYILERHKNLQIMISNKLSEDYNLPNDSKMKDILSEIIISLIDGLYLNTSLLGIENVRSLEQLRGLIEILENLNKENENV